ncbi:MAG TPA: hypothetical protein VGT03_05015 [Candidatus Acidoferrales bacterium]|nr:hypothetical protein [Candidatus Acidoferrales bacterium]
MNSAMLATFFLTLVGGGLVYAALYGFFAKPSTFQGQVFKHQIIHGFQLAGGVLLGFVLMGGLVFFSGIAMGATPASLAAPRPFAGFVTVLLLILITLMVQWWAKYFPGWILWGILNGLIMAESGHSLNNPAIQVKRSSALTIAGLCFVTVLVSRRFTESYKLHSGEKLALMAWIVGFTLAVNVERFSIPAIALGTLALVSAWWLHRCKSHRRSSHAT